MNYNDEPSGELNFFEFLLLSPILIGAGVTLVLLMLVNGAIDLYNYLRHP